MQSNWTLHQLTDLHQQDLLRQAAQDRLVALAKGEQASAWRKVLVGLGQQLVSIGQHLQQQHGAAIQLQTEANA